MHHLYIHHPPPHIIVTTLSPSSRSSRHYHQHRSNHAPYVAFRHTAVCHPKLSPCPLRPRLPPNPMPGPHLDAFTMQTYGDVGGIDIWIISYYQGNAQWWVGWHSLAPFHGWHLSEDHQWFLIGYELWYTPLTGIPYLSEAHYNDPNPSTTPWGEDLTPQGHWIVQCNFHGKLTYNNYHPWALPPWYEGNAFLRWKPRQRQR